MKNLEEISIYNSKIKNSKKISDFANLKVLKLDGSLVDEPNLIKVFLYAPSEYRINKIKEMYKDTHKEAEKHIVQSDKSRALYYEIISNKKWGDKENYDICLDCSIGNEKVVNIICDYINEKNK